MATWDQGKAKVKYGEQIGAAERVHPGITNAKNALKADFEKYDTTLSKGSLMHASQRGDREHLFPARYYTKSEEEKNWQLHQEATKELATAFKDTKNVTLTTAVPDKYVEWIEAKQKADFYVGFDRWIEDAFLDGDLAKRDFIKLSYPEYFEAREAEVQAKQELDKKIFDLKLHGATDISDLRLEYLLRTGAVVPDPTPIWDSSQGGTRATVLNRGFLSTHKWLLNGAINTATPTMLPFSATGISEVGSRRENRPQAGRASDWMTGNREGVPAAFFGSNHTNLQ